MADSKVSDLALEATTTSASDWMYIASFNGTTWDSKKIKPNNVGGKNFANANLTLTGNRSHDGDSNRMTMAKFKDFTFETFIAPTIGLASLNFNGYGSSISDETHAFNSDNGVTMKMFGDNSSIFYGVVTMEAITPIYFGSSTQGINKNSSANAVRIFKSGAGDWTFGWNFAELRGFGTFASDSIEINNDNSESYFTQIESTTGRKWKFGHKGGDGSIAGKIGGGLVDTEIVKIDRTNGSFDLSLGLLKLTGIPTSSAGLASGTVWNHSGTLRIV
jgi:hypothetical protein